MKTSDRGRLVITKDTLTPGLKAFGPQVDAAVGKTVDYFTIRAEAYMKENAPWTDRTGNARNTLHAEAFHEPPVQHGIVCAHGMPYGFWLEVIQEGRFEIINPTIEAIGHELMNGLALLFARM